MANLIITVIAIALVAVASLMGAYYGGSAFLNNSSAAEASAVVNQGQQIAGAWQAYLGDNLNTPPATLGALVPSYLQSVPQYPASAGSTAAATWDLVTATVGGTAHYYGIADLGAGGTNQTSTTALDPNAAACNRIIKTATGANTNINPQTAAFTTVAAGGTSYGTAAFGCAYSTTTNPLPTSMSGTPPAANHYYAYYQLS